MTLPDGTLSVEHFATTGWQRGLTVKSELFDTAQATQPKKWTHTTWTQDDEALAYQKNPRPSEINVHDAEGNRRRTALKYTAYGLPQDVYEYAADGATVVRHTRTEYRDDPEFISKRILGLVSRQMMYDGAGTLHSKVIYDYDTPQHPSLLQDTAQPATHHHNPSYVLGRGNLVLMKRYDAIDPDNESKAVEVQTGYYSTGTPRFTLDHAGHQTTIGYQDAFSDGVNRNTFAYPTQVTDADGHSSKTQYHYDHAQVTRSEGPPPAGHTTGLVRVLSYDAAGRLARVTTENNKAYTRWEYPVSGTSVMAYTTTHDSTEHTTHTVFDGAGRVRARSGQLPPAGGASFWGQFFLYDGMGRLTEQTNPTQITAAWQPRGADAAGWKWTKQQYDWQGRPTITTHPDGTQRILSYGGCGCAGGVVTTIRDESGRRRRLTQDVVGRLARTEELNWDGGVYATTDYTYNGRDQLTNINHAGSGRTFNYDGHGRLIERTTPEQGRTTYSYNADDTLRMMVDARGAAATYSYNGRHLPTEIKYGGADGGQTVPAGVAATATVTMGYDAAGNRTRLTDGAGTVAYAYNDASQLAAETRTFTELPAKPFTLKYGYDLGGQLTTIETPWQATVGYERNAAGQVTGITGAGYAGVTHYASGIEYGAAGQLKGLTYGNNRRLTVAYDERGRITKWDGGGVLGWEYSYGHFYKEHTGRVSYARNLYDATLDRGYSYDHVGRLERAHTGAEARVHVGLAGSAWGTKDGPYSHGYTYDVWGNITHRSGWGGPHPAYTITHNERNQIQVGRRYDAAGNFTDDAWGQTFTYDATGQQARATVLTEGTVTADLQHVYDGDRLRVKKIENNVATYYIRSSVLGGQVVGEVDKDATWTRGYVYDGGGGLLAVQQAASVHFVHQDPVTKSQAVTMISGAAHPTVIDTDPWGGETKRSHEQGWLAQRFTSYHRDDASASPTHNGDDAQQRRYHSAWSRFDQPDPYDGSMDMTNPQSLNRYAYTRNDPVNRVDPSGLADDDHISINVYAYRGFNALWSVWWNNQLGNGWWGTRLWTVATRLIQNRRILRRM